MPVKQTTVEDRWIPNFCWNCVEGPCSLMVHVVNGVAMNIEGYTPGPGLENQVKNQGRLCPKSYGMLQKLYNPHKFYNTHNLHKLCGHFHPRIVRSLFYSF